MNGSVLIIVVQGTAFQLNIYPLLDYLDSWMLFLFSRWVPLNSWLQLPRWTNDQIRVATDERTMSSLTSGTLWMVNICAKVWITGMMMLSKVDRLTDGEFSDGLREPRGGNGFTDRLLNWIQETERFMDGRMVQYLSSLPLLLLLLLPFFLSFLPFLVNC